MARRRQSLSTELIGLLLLALAAVGIVVPTPRRVLAHAYIATYQATLGAALNAALDPLLHPATPSPSPSPSR